MSERIETLRKRLFTLNRCWSDTICDCYQQKISEQILEQYDALAADNERLRARLAEVERERDAAWSVARAHEETMDALRARLAEAERDAARYRWLRSPQSGQSGWWHIKFNDDPSKIDAAIDAAMDRADSAPTP